MINAGYGCDRLRLMNLIVSDKLGFFYKNAWRSILVNFPSRNSHCSAIWRIKNFTTNKISHSFAGGENVSNGVDKNLWDSTSNHIVFLDIQIYVLCFIYISTIKVTKENME